jgi:hypothetical protein
VECWGPVEGRFIIIIIIIIIIITIMEFNDLYCSPKCSGDQIENEMGGASSTYGGEERRIQGFVGEA